MSNTPESSTLWHFARRTIPALAVVLVAGVAVTYLMNTSSHAKRGKPTREARLVEVVSVSPTTVQLAIEAWGTVEPARQIELQAQVAGEVQRISDNLEPGAYVDQGEQLVQIDPSDYQLAVRQRKADQVKAEADLALEAGKGAVAKQEFALLKQTSNPSKEQRSLMLREPQQATARASVAAAEAALAAAELDLARTRIPAPFNALVLERQVDSGARVAVGGSLATLVGTDSFWVELAVPAASLRWIGLPGADRPGSTVRLYQDLVWGKGHHRKGQVIRLRGDLDEKGRMARLLVAVPDPLARQDSAQDSLLIGAFVRAEIEGLELQDVLALERAWLRDEDALWVMDAEGKLAIRKPEVVYRGVNQVYARGGLSPGDRIVTSELSVAVEGMPLRLADERGQEGGKQRSEQDAEAAPANRTERRGA
ncbi:MAG: efflux RND transporter periplasmic adaptor subunit [Candidatus Thiodiazotropha sp.]